MEFEPELTGKNKEKILEEATEQFFSKGYDATSVRDIMNKLEIDPSLFYYYYKNKEELYDCVIDGMFVFLRNGLNEIVENGRRDPFRMMYQFFDYFADGVQYFDSEYGDIVHSSVRLAIRERVLYVIQPYIRRMLDMLVADGAKLKLHIEATTLFLAQGMGSIIIQYNDYEDVDMIKEFRKGIHVIMGLNDEMAEIMFPYFSENEDLPGISALIMKNSDYIFEAQEHAKQTELIRKSMAKEIFVIRYCGKIVGVVGFSRKNNEIDYICIDEEFGKKGIAMRLIVTAMAQYPIGKKITAKLMKRVHGEQHGVIRFFSKYGFTATTDETDEYITYEMTIRDPNVMQNNSRR